MNLRQFLIGRPVVIASHASPAYRGKVGEMIALAGGIATVRIKTPRCTEEIAIPLNGLRLIRRPDKAPPPRSFLSLVLSSARRAAFAGPSRGAHRARSV